MIVVCLGMPRSGSTWAFNVVRDLLTATLGSVASCEATSLEALSSALSEAHGAKNVVIRCHTMTSSMMSMLKLADAKFVLTFRDPRDSIASLKFQLGGYAANWCIDVIRSLTSIQTAKNSVVNSLVFTFEDGFIEDPKTPSKIAEYLGLSIEGSCAAEIASQWSKEKVVEYIETVVATAGSDAGQGWRSDSRTGFNERHIGDGRIGKWIDLDFCDEAKLVDRAFIRGDDISSEWGDGFRFSERFFGLAAQPSGVERFSSNATSVGERFISPCYLSAGCWSVSLVGEMPMRPYAFWLRVVDGGSLAFEKLIEPRLAEANLMSISIFEEFCLDHYSHDSAIEVLLEGGFRTLPDPFREKSIELIAVKK